MRKLLTLLLLLSITVVAQAGVKIKNNSSEEPFIKTQVSVGTNLISLAYLGTLNAQLGVAVHQNWSVIATAKINPFTWHSSDAAKQFQSRQATMSLGTRYWPWHINAGWFVGGNLQFTNYNHGGLFGYQETYEGKLYSLGANLGYAFMLTKRLNLEVGAGVAVGATDYTQYACPKCGQIIGEKKKLVILPDNVMVQLNLIL